MATSTASPMRVSPSGWTVASLVSAPVRSDGVSSSQVGVHTVSTVIRLTVSVPVLSDPMTVVEPSVSTLGRCRTTALRVAMRDTPTPIATDRTTGSASGIEETISATVERKASPSPVPRMRLVMNTATPTTTSSTAMVFSSRSVRICSGVFPLSVWTRSAMEPSSVS